jgi:hypothetical protein
MKKCRIIFDGEFFSGAEKFQDPQERVFGSRYLTRLLK